jgi:hypothetical protein
MYRIGKLVRRAESPSQEPSNSIGVLGTVKIPNSTARLRVWSGRSVKHDIDGIGHVHMKASTVGVISEDAPQVDTLSALSWLSDSDSRSKATRAFYSLLGYPSVRCPDREKQAYESVIHLRSYIWTRCASRELPGQQLLSAPHKHGARACSPRQQ